MNPFYFYLVFYSPLVAGTFQATYFIILYPMEIYEIDHFKKGVKYLLLLLLF